MIHVMKKETSGSLGVIERSVMTVRIWCGPSAVALRS